MVNYKEILRLSDQGYSQRQIETRVGSSRHIKSKMLETANTKGIKLPIEDDVSNYLGREEPTAPQFLVRSLKPTAGTGV